MQRLGDGGRERGQLDCDLSDSIRLYLSSPRAMLEGPGKAHVTTPPHCVAERIEIHPYDAPLLEALGDNHFQGRTPGF